MKADRASKSKERAILARAWRFVDMLLVFGECC